VALQASLQEIVSRHEVLRTVFIKVEGKAELRISRELVLRLPVDDVRGFEDIWAETWDRVEKESRQSFDLCKGPLIRTRLLRIAEEEHILIVTMHHIVSDGWSMGVLVKELTAAYAAASAGREASLPPLAMQYADYAVWQRAYLRGSRLEMQIQYWKNQLEGAPPVLKLPTDRPRPTVQNFLGSSERFEIGLVTADRLKALGQAHDSTLFMTLLAAFGVLMSRYTDQEDIVIGTPIANRTREELEPLIGFFVNTLALRTDFSGNPTFREILGRVRKTALEAYSHQDLPFEKLVDELQLERDLSRNPLFQVMFALQNAPSGVLQLGDLGIRALEPQRTTALFDIVMDMWETDGGLVGVLEYNREIFDASTVHRMIRHFQILLEGLAAEPDRCLSDLPLLSGEERHQLLETFRGKQVQYPVDRTISDLFEEQVARGPVRIAAIHNDEQITYAALNERANRLAGRLRKAGLEKNDFVGVLDERGIDFLVAVIGILKAGGAFLPIDPAYPVERVRYMLKDSGVATVITRSGLAQRILGTERSPVHAAPIGAFENLRNIICMDDTDAIAAMDGGNVPPVSTSADYAYMLYTSGSTGQPKGAIVRHDGAVNHIYAQFDELGFHRDTAFLQSAPSSSDISVWQFLAPLLIGGKTVIADFETVCDPARLFAAIRGVTLIELVPVVLQEILRHALQLPEEDRKLPRLEMAMVTGEAVSVALVNKWFQVYPQVKLANAYGPTEAADDICQEIIEAPLPLEQRNVPIGHVLANLTMYVLDRRLNLVPMGVPGEICVSGIGVGAGYWHQEEKTAASFKANPYRANGRGDVLYRTGDLGRWLPDGRLEYLGRMDDQVKLRGFRIELGEVEAVLAGHPDVQEAAALIRDDVLEHTGKTCGEKRLVAYIVVNPAGAGVKAKAGQYQAEQVNLWQTLHEDSYRGMSANQDPTFNYIGWDSTYTGEPLSEEEMREYVHYTVDRVLAGKPQRVYEIGCGTGLLAFQMIPRCAHYCGTDLSHVAVESLQQIQSQAAVRSAIRNVEHAVFMQKVADDFSGLGKGVFDVLMLCSVVQYFPSVDYLLAVLEGAIDVLDQNGRIFIGDVRSLPLLEAYHTSIQMFKAEPALPAGALQARIREQMAIQQELAIDPAFFFALRQRFPRLAHVQVLPKRGRIWNEQTRFRYDVVLHLDRTDKVEPVADWIAWNAQEYSLRALAGVLARKPDALALRGVANARVQEEQKALSLLSARGMTMTAAEIREAVANT
jgi:amino acid adenylation domain-containing protein